MIQNLSRPMRWLIPAVAIILGSACILESAAGPTPTPQVIVVPGDGQGGSPEPVLPSPTLESILTLTATITFTPEPTSTATTAPVTMTAGQDLSCVKGPHWVLFEWVARINEGEVVTLLAKASPEWEEYYYVRKSGGAECWAFGGSSTKSGDLSTLPLRDAPPLPGITYTVENRMYLHVADIFIRGKDEAAWGADRLGAGMINPAASTAIPLTAGFYDVRMRDDWGEILYEKHDIPIGPEPSSSNIRLENQYSVTILNSSATNICRLNISALLAVISMDLTIPGDGVLSPGETIGTEGVAGIYWFKAFRCSDNALFREIGGFRIGPVHKSYNLP
jgi:hypothetical protein